ncbi:molybdenum cofactor synthesis domain-containing protein [Deferribacter abyssi]|uniref:molybdenum cofactor synthesis domain-containing protein n=1 Tax=Deferribacter abyssi TaxID=213806 RepID=UPI003C27FEA4
MGKVYAISISEKKGTRKSNVDKVQIKKGHGIVGDAHAGDWHRQVSFLAIESIEKMRKLGLDVKSGDFAENITTQGVELCRMKVGERIIISGVEFVISQIGKVCHHRCAIYYQAGDCIMPKEGIFAVVKNDGDIQVGDEIEIMPKDGFSVAIITLSDKGSKGEREDITGLRIKEYLQEKMNISFIRYEMIPDEKVMLENMLVDFCDLQCFDLVITNGSTGISPRDIAPNVTKKVIDNELPGFGEAMRMASFQKTSHAIISRALAGTRRDTLILNLPGSPKGAIENLEVVIDAIPHTIKKLQGDKEDCARN